MLPAWASKKHPIVEREIALWQKRSRPWRWAWALVFVIPLLCSSMCGLSTFIAAVDSPNADKLIGSIIALITTISVALWILHGFMMFAIWILSSIGTSTVIAHERETQNWSLLRITPLKIHEVVTAKIVGVLRWLILPISFTFILRLLMTAIGWIIAIALFYAASRGVNTLTPEIKIGITLGSVPVVFIALVYFTLDLIASIIYNCSIGLLASSFSRTSATAVAITLILNFVSSFFVMAPAQQVVYMITSIASLQFITSSNAAAQFVFPLASVVVSLIVNLVMQIGISLFAYFLAVNQAQHITD